MEYLAVLLILLASAIFIEKKNHIHLYESIRQRLIIVFVFFVVGVLWDHFAIFRGHWFFPGPGMVGIRFGLMPLEEYLFILIIPFWIITVYKLLTKKIK